jgi:hypothetical protein
VSDLGCERLGVGGMRWPPKPVPSYPSKVHKWFGGGGGSTGSLHFLAALRYRPMQEFVLCRLHSVQSSRSYTVYEAHCLLCHSEIFTEEFGVALMFGRKSVHISATTLVSLRLFMFFLSRRLSVQQK